MGCLFVLILLPVLLIIGFLSNASTASEQRQLADAAKRNAENRVRRIEHYFDQLAQDASITHRWYGQDMSRSIGFDEHSDTIYLVDSSGSQIVHSRYQPADLLDVAVIEDGDIITQTRTDRTGQLVGAVVGEVLFGPVGAIVGGLTADKSSTLSTTASSIELRLTLNDTNYPLWRVLFMNSSADKQTAAYQTARDQVLTWQARFSLLIRRIDREAAASPAAASLALPDGQTTYHVSRKGEDIGSMPLARIRLLLNSGHLTTEDYYFDPQLNEWMLLSLLPEA